MAIDMKTDYWKLYYQLQKRVENGECRTDFNLRKQRDEAYNNAVVQSEQVKRNWNSLGVSNG
jgi:hypothetical protein